MKRMCVILVAAVLAAAANAMMLSEGGCPGKYDAVVDSCVASVEGGHRNTCAFFSCIAANCPTQYTRKTARDVCVDGTIFKPDAETPVAKDGDDRSSAASVSKKMTSNVTVGEDVHSPCFKHNGKPWTLEEKKHQLLAVSMTVYAKRAEEHYTENMVERWVGIRDRICPSRVPPTSDCSSTVTWIYWTLFGNGPDFLNGESWKAGYTGTLVAHGRGASEKDLEIGDLCFYYHPMHHVAIYVGGGKVVSHGADPVGYYAWDYAPVDGCRKYL